MNFQPQSAISIAYIQPFELKESYKFDWRSDLEEVGKGLLIVVKVDTNLVIPKNAIQPVLFAGNETVQRLNHGHKDGYVIGIVPSLIEIANEPIWFGTPNLPERINKHIIQEEKKLAESFGIKSIGSLSADLKIQEMVEADNLTTLLREVAADLIIQFAPQERHIAESWRLPVLGVN